MYESLVQQLINLSLIVDIRWKKNRIRESFKSGVVE
jgi:hypothetical protein